ncbi:MAG: hypothetical protein RI887_1028, partial [Actinomycetota bacterium]
RVAVAVEDDALVLAQRSLHHLLHGGQISVRAFKPSAKPFASSRLKVIES